MLSNNNYIVRRLGTNKTQLLHCIRLRKFTPQSPLADIFVRETDWQKDDQMPIEHDDLYAQSWNTNFGPNPFEDNPSEYSQNADDIEYLPIRQPDQINHPPSREISQNSGGSPVEQTTEREEEKHEENPQVIINDESEISQKTPPENTQETLTQGKTAENSQNTPLQEESINTRGEKYNLRPNPNPNYSDSYRY